MKTISTQLFAELKSQSSRIDVGWLIIRKDNARFAFTSSDIPFTYNGDVYSPTNGFNPSAVVSKSNFSVDNLECQVLENSAITDSDLRSGLWDLAQVNIFWICRYHPEWGVVPLRSGWLGEIVIKEGEWTTQLRSLFEQLQQPFGYFYSLQCMAQLGDARCKVKLSVPTWQPNTSYRNGLLTDAAVGDIVQPTHPNGFWYVAQYTGYNGVISSAANPPPSNVVSPAPITAAATSTPVTAGSFVIGKGYFIVTVGSTNFVAIGAAQNTVGWGFVATGVGSGTGTASLQQAVSQTGVITEGVAIPGYGGEPIRPVTQPGQGLSGNDDLGPNDMTQVSVGPAWDNLREFVYDGIPIDVFGIVL